MSHTLSFQVFIFVIVVGVLYVLEEIGERKRAKSLPGPHFSSVSFWVPSFSPRASGRGAAEGERGGRETQDQQVCMDAAFGS